MAVMATLWTVYCHVSLSSVFSLSFLVWSPVVVLASLVVACYLLVSYVVVGHIDGVCFTKGDTKQSHETGLLITYLDQRFAADL